MAGVPKLAALATSVITFCASGRLAFPRTDQEQYIFSRLNATAASSRMDDEGVEAGHFGNDEWHEAEEGERRYILDLSTGTLMGNFQ